ncbi:hypothetical protein [Chryseolinea sp. H1M3-3]|uniref:hypothetical protein n=1 Tax=Chryseolinea sp. H1M3-3 TaxID=3034144 RepID=UPI0023EA9C4F|nr:hypothetical protein [Chryseolinea sp. H1M3-3]
MFFTLTKWWLSNGVALFLLLTFFQSGNAQQVLQTNRYELPVEKNDYYEVMPSQEDGIYLHRRLHASDDDKIELIKLDTAFLVNWKGYLSIDKRMSLIAKRAIGGNFFLLLRHPDLKRNNMQLFAVSQANGNYINYQVKNFIPFVPTEFQVTEKAALIGGYFNQVPVVLYFSFTTQRSKILPGLLNESGELTQVKTFPDGTFDVLISARNHLKQQTVWIKSYDANGELQSNYALNPEENKHLIFARAMKTEEDVQLIAGVYGGRNSEYSRGLFLASVSPDGVQQLRYYNYGDLENFFKYMKAKREQRVKDRIERRKVKGKKIKFSYRFLVHEIVPYNNQFILLGEAFYPRYKSVETSYGFFSGNPAYNSIRNGRVFDGYSYTHAVVMGFDENGKLLWDNSFEINDVKTFTLEQFVKLEIQEDRIALLYLFENELRSKIIQNNEVLEGKTFEPIKTIRENEIIKKEETEISKLDYWYQDFFYAYGIQEITNPKTGKRRVFFINKISCQ